MSAELPRQLQLPAHDASQEEYKDFAKQLEIWIDVIRARHDEQRTHIAELQQINLRIHELQFVTRKVAGQMEEKRRLLKHSDERLTWMESKNVEFSADLNESRIHASMPRDMSLDGAGLAADSVSPPSEGPQRAMMLQLVRQSFDKELKRRRDAGNSSESMESDDEFGGHETGRGRKSTTASYMESTTFPVESSDLSVFSSPRPQRTRKRTLKSIEQDNSATAAKKRRRSGISEPNISYRPSTKPEESCFCSPDGGDKAEISIFDVFSRNDAFRIVGNLSEWDHHRAQSKTAKYEIWVSYKQPSCLRRRMMRVRSGRDDEKWACDECIKKHWFCWARGKSRRERIVLLPLPEKYRAKELSIRDLDYWRLPPTKR